MYGLKWPRVNSVFLVQLRKKNGRGFRGSTRMKQGMKNVTLDAPDDGILIWREQCGRKSGRVGRRNIHRGAQEMQKGRSQCLSSQSQFQFQFQEEWLDERVGFRISRCVLARFAVRFFWGRPASKDWSRCGVGICLMGAEIRCGRMSSSSSRGEDQGDCRERARWRRRDRSFARDLSCRG